LGSAIELNKEWIFINTYAMECEATEIDKLIDYAISSDSAHRLQHMIKNGDFDKAREYILDVTGKGSELSRSSAAPPDAEELLLAIIEAGSGHPREAMKHLQDIKDNLKQNNGLDPEGWSLHIISDIEANLQTNL
jgi:hypothetical protein